jgi:hypothetical protein
MCIRQSTIVEEQMRKFARYWGSKCPHQSFQDGLHSLCKNGSTLKVRKSQKMFFVFNYYRVSHSKEGKVNLLWWVDKFWFLLIFWVLRVHEIGSFMPHSSFFIEIMMLAFYGPKCKKAKINFGKKSLNVHSVKLFSKLFFQLFWFFLYFFCFKPLIKGNYISIYWFDTF